MHIRSVIKCWKIIKAIDCVKDDRILTYIWKVGSLMSNTKRIYESESSQIGSIQLKSTDPRKRHNENSRSRIELDKRLITPDVIYRLIERIKEL
jgi:hypothetical protein